MLGGGAGHIADMISRLKQNRAWLKRKRYFKQHIKSGDLDFLKHEEQHLTHKKATKKQLQKIRDEASDSRQKIINKKVTILFVSILITLAIFFFIEDIYYFFAAIFAVE